MNEYLLSVLLGVIEGLTEFLPISSTAHLRIAEAAFGVDLANGYWKMYAIVIQAGAILCLPIYFRKRIWSFLATFPKGQQGNRTWLSHPLTLVFIACAFTAPALLLTRIIGKNLENIPGMAVTLIVGGAVMWMVDAIYGPRAGPETTSDVEQVTAVQAVVIGLSQIVAAVFPGVSRSLATIAGGQICGMTRSAALEFSFLLSIPTMIAATGYELFKSMATSRADDVLGTHGIDAHGWIVLGIGFVVSFVVAYAVVAWFMHWVRRHGFVVFAVYRIVFGLGVLVWISRT